MGNVMSEICNEPLSGIKVTIEDNNQKILIETFTDESGKFSISTYSEGFEEKLYLKFSDVDGEKNNGIFLPHTENFLPERIKNVDVTMSYNGQIPCLEVPVVEVDSVVKAFPTINVETATIPPKQTPVIPELLDEVLIYPNPNTGNFTISFTLHEKGTVNLIVYASSGQLVYAENYTLESGVQTLQLSIPHVATGNYLLTLKRGSKIVSKNIIIKQ